MENLKASPKSVCLPLTSLTPLQPHCLLPAPQVPCVLWKAGILACRIALFPGFFLSRGADTMGTRAASKRLVNARQDRALDRVSPAAGGQDDVPASHMLFLCTLLSPGISV